MALCVRSFVLICFGFGFGFLFCFVFSLKTGKSSRSACESLVLTRSGEGTHFQDKSTFWDGECRQIHRWNGQRVNEYSIHYSLHICVKRSVEGGFVLFELSQ